MREILKKIMHFGAKSTQEVTKTATKSQFFVFFSMLTMTILWSNSAFAFGFGFLPSFDLNTLVFNVLFEINNIPDLISIFSYIAGVFCAATGVIALKNHVDNPQEPIAKGIIRLAVGAGLLALPALTEVVVNTFGLKSILWRAAVLGDFGLAAPTAFGESSFDFASLVQNFAVQTIDLPLLMSAFAYIAGVAFLALGLLGLKRHGEQPSPDQFRTSIGKIALAGFLLALPQVTDIVVNTLGLGPEFLASIWLLNPLADSTSLVSEDLKSLSYKSVGQIIALPQVLVIISYIIGVAFVFMGLFSVKRYIDSPQQGGVKEAIGRFATGAGLLSLPSVASIAVNSLGLSGLSGNSFANDFAAHGSEAGAEASNQVTGAIGVETLVATVSDQFSAIPLVIVMFSFVAATLMVLTGLVSLKKHVDNPQEPLKNSLSKFGIAGILFALPVFIDLVLSTLGFNGILTSSVFQVDAQTDVNQADNLEKLISNIGSIENAGAVDAQQTGALGALYSALDVFGYIAGMFLITFGVFSLKKNLELGEQQAPLKNSLAQMFAGAALLSLPTLIKIVVGSLGLGADSVEYQIGGAGETGLVKLLSSILNQASSLPGLILMIASFGGLILLISGFLSLKKHIESPQEPLAKGLGRLAIGSALITLDFFGSVLSNTLGLGRNTSASIGELEETDTELPLGGIFENVTNQIGGVPGIIMFVAIVAGLVYLFSALMSFKRHVDSPPNEPLQKSVVSLLLGGAFLGFGAIVPLLVGIFDLTSIQDQGFAGLTGLENLSGGTTASAAGDGTIGGSIISLQENIVLYGGLLEMLSYVVGLGFAAITIMKFKEHVDNPQVQLIEPIKHGIAAAGFLGLPAFATIILQSFDITGGLTIENFNLGGGEGDSAGGESGSVDSLFTSMAANIYPSMMTMLQVFSILAGLTFMFIGVYRLTLNAQAGARGPFGMGTAFTFLTGAVLLAMPEAMGLFSQTLFGESSIKVNALLSLEDGGGGLNDRAEQVFSAITAFMVLIGFISFIRGWFLLKAFAEGNQQATLMAASSHIIAGVLAVNIGPLVNALQLTLGVEIGDAGIKF